MGEQTFKSPGFFENEIDLSTRAQEKLGIPAGVIGTADLGPAFVPINLGSMVEFVNKFGNLNHERFGPYAVNEFLKNRSSLTYVRVLGAGANETTTDIEATAVQGTVKNAGFIIRGQPADAAGAAPAAGAYAGCVQFVCANHEIHNASQESNAYPIFTDNDSFGTGQANVVRGMLFLASSSRMEILDGDRFYKDIAVATTTVTTASITSYDNSKTQGTFKLVLSQSQPSSLSQEGYTGIKIYTASLDPNSDFYISKVLNTDPRNFSSEAHLLYGEFPVESEIARVKYDGTHGTVSLLSGSTDTHRNNFGRFDTRYSSARTTSFITQPFGEKEYDLFHFETLNDGANSSHQVKVSISNIRRSSDPLNPYGTFNVEIRKYTDNDISPQIFETFVDCDLNPNSENYIAKKIGDKKIFYDFDATSESERRLVSSGKFTNRSSYVRIKMNPQVDNGSIPKESLPFGFRGIPSLITNLNMTDTTGVDNRLIGNGPAASETGATNSIVSQISGSIIPPLPFTIKTTRGKVKGKSTSFFGHPGNAETADPRIYWGVKTTRIPLTSSLTDAALATNASGIHNPLVDSYTKLLGIQKLGVLTSGSKGDEFNNNKFSLKNVAFFNAGTVASQITGSADEHILEAAYIRNASSDNAGKLDTVDYLVTDGAHGSRITLGTLVSNDASKYFNRFTEYAKFTNVFHGGFDGLNILDDDMRKMNDKSTSTDTGGKASGGVISRVNLSSNYSPGVGLANNIVASYRAATRILTDPLASNVNIVTIPGQRDSFIIDHLIDKTEEYGKAIAVIDIPNLDDDGNRLFDDDIKIPSVRQTSETFDGRALDSNFAATYFPNVTIQDDTNSRLVVVPPTVAALGALGFSDSVSYPWFAPAGFNRGALDFVQNAQTRLTAADRDTLYEARINPIAKFPNSGFVIFGQKTLQFAKTSLDRVNVRRMLLEVRRLVSDAANNLVFEQNTQETRNRFITQVTPLLATIQSQQGIDSFKVVMDSSNNTAQDAEQNRLNGRIVLVPTRAIEFIAVDFIITNSGVSFE